MRASNKHSRGVTLVELLVVLLIISLLAVVAVPVYLNQVATARVRTAQQEVRELGMAMDACGAIHGFYVPLQMLDDLPDLGNDMSSEADDVGNYSGLLPFFVKVDVPLTAQLGSFQRRYTTDGGTDPDVVRLLEEWQGPFVNFNRFWKGAFTATQLKTSEIDSTTDEVKTDLPLDPWGEPYRIFSPLGLTGSNSPTNDMLDAENLYQAASSLFPNHDLELPTNTGGTSVRSQVRPYDRWAIVSLGPDQEGDVPDSSDVKDDIIYIFGFVQSETNLSQL